MKELDEFLANWPDTAEGNRAAFAALRAHLEGQDGVTLDFIARPGITYSLRAKHAAQKKRELFVMVDVIEDDPRWLSVCFYRDLTSDPDSLGDEVPEGLSFVRPDAQPSPLPAACLSIRGSLSTTLKSTTPSPSQKSNSKQAPGTPTKITPKTRR